MDQGVSAAPSTGERPCAPGLGETETGRLERLRHRPARGQRGSNRRRRRKTAIGRLKARETDRREDWVEKVSTDLARRDAKSRESQAIFRCRARGHADHADVNAAKNIAAGRAVTARGGRPVGGPVNREPQPVFSSA
jgi:transposase